MRNMSFAKTTDQVRAGTKTVTRRMGWKNIKIGEWHMAVEKGQGIPKGSHVVKIREFIPTSSRREPLRRMIDDPVYGRKEVIKEGFPEMTPQEFVDMFCKMNKCTPESLVNRIEFKLFPYSPFSPTEATNGKAD